MELVSGSHGFIGQAIYDHLQDRGLVSSRVDRNLNFQGEGKVGTVYHLASYGNLYGQDERMKIMQANIHNTAKLLDKMDLIGCNHFVYFSSSSVYQRQHTPLKEFSPLLGGTDYADSKITAEKIAMAHANYYPVTIVRPFSVTGVGEQSIHLIPTLIRSAIEGEEICLDPDPVHDFIDIEDVLSALDTINRHRLRDKRGWQIYNIGSGIQYSNLEVLKILEQILGKKIPFTDMKNQRDYDTVSSWRADNSRLRKLGWEPHKKLYDIVSEMVKQYEKR